MSTGAHSFAGPLQPLQSSNFEHAPSLALHPLHATDSARSAAKHVAPRPVLVDIRDSDENQPAAPPRASKRRRSAPCERTNAAEEERDARLSSAARKRVLDAQGTRSELLAQQTQLRSELQECQDQLAASQQIAADAAEKAATMQSRLAALETDRSLITAHLAALHRSLAESEQRRQAAVTLLTSTQAELSRLEQVGSKTTAQLSEVQLELTASTSALLAERRAREDFDRRNLLLCRELVALAAARDDARSELRQSVLNAERLETCLKEAPADKVSLHHDLLPTADDMLTMQHLRLVLHACGTWSRPVVGCCCHHSHDQLHNRTRCCSCRML